MVERVTVRKTLFAYIMQECPACCSRIASFFRAAHQILIDFLCALYEIFVRLGIQWQACPTQTSASRPKVNLMTHMLIISTAYWPIT
jgi:hypothetical protein